MTIQRLRAGLAAVLVAALVFAVVPLVHAQAPPAAGGGQIRPGGMSQPDLVRLLKAMRNRLVGTAAFAGGGLAVATNTAKVKTGGAVQYMIDGVLYTKAATDDFCTLAGTATTTTNGAYYRFEIDAAGACSVTQGPIAAVASGTLNGPLVIPARAASKATLGVLLVAGQAFTPGTTTTAASATVVYTNGDPDLNTFSLEP